ncbi:hypothetical protein CL176_01480 [Suicoccus acidiformans]|uniref:ABC transmembrane type-1 domain-containing protein n=1 Tax=Suicoccus acidiformans TaxID=2036206 RepID=A0A347WI85_9LACT|nr:hypothetical protein CL176_01480 [Suicoccus acidiformans]
MRQTIDTINQKFRENSTGIRVVKAFKKTDYEERAFAQATDASFDANVKAESTMMLLSPLILLVANALTLVILYNGGTPRRGR